MRPRLNRQGATNNPNKQTNKPTSQPNEQTWRKRQTNNVIQPQMLEIGWNWMKLDEHSRGETKKLEQFFVAQNPTRNEVLDGQQLQQKPLGRLGRQATSSKRSKRQHVLEIISQISWISMVYLSSI